MKQHLLKIGNFLISLFFPVSKEKRFVNHLSLIVLSLIMAYCIWLIAMFTVMTMQAINIPILITNAPPNAAVRIESPASQNINVMVNIPKNLVPTVNPSNFIFELDLSDISSQITSLETVHEYPISPLDVKIINLPGLISISEVMPRSIRLRINYHHKKVPLRINVEGNPLPGFYYEEEEVSAIPSELTVVASQRILRDLEHIETYPINIAGRSSSFTQNVALNIPSNVEIFDHPRQVEAFIPIQEEVIEEKISFVKVLLEKVTDEFEATVEPDEVTVIVKGPQSLVPQLSARDIKIELVVPAQEGTIQKDIRLEFSEDVSEVLRENITLVGSEPDNVTIENIPIEEEIEDEEEEEAEEVDEVEIERGEDEDTELPEDNMNVGEDS